MFLKQVAVYSGVFSAVLLVTFAVPGLWALVKFCGVVCFLCMLSRRATTEVYTLLGRKPVSAKNKAVLITGCDTGFGHELVKRLDQRGFTVYAGCLFPDGDGAQKLRETCSENVTVLPLDVTKDKQVEDAVRAVKDSLGGKDLWAIVANAGVIYAAEMEWGKLDLLYKTFEVNVFGVVRSVKAFLPLIRKARGRVIVSTSLWSHYSVPFAVGYCMSKCSARFFVDGLRKEMKKFGVKVVSIEPNMYATNLTADNILVPTMEKQFADTPEEVRKEYGDAYLKKCQECLLKGLNDSRPNISEVIDSFEESVTASVPKYAYHPDGVVRSLLWRLVYIAPPPMQDFIFNSFSQPREFLANRNICRG
ncbi:short-chain dehydrogenase/reductase family 9C member 7-like isoform X2 [Ornithodoros turicata]